MKPLTEERRSIMELMNPWMLMEDGCVVGDIKDEFGRKSTFRTHHVIDIIPLSSGNAVLETEYYYCELGKPVGRCKGCGKVTGIDDESLLCEKCDVDVEMGF